MSADQNKRHFDLHVAGIGYLNRIREVKPRKGSPFHACSINALRGDGDAPEYTRFDLIIRGGKAEQRVLSLREAVERRQKVIVAFKLGDIYPDLFTYDSGDRKGQAGVAIKGRLLQVNATTIDGIRVDWVEAGMPDEVRDNASHELRDEAPVQAG